MLFRPFDQQVLNEFLQEHSLSEEAKNYLNRALEKPSRNVAGSTRNMVSDNPCPKMKCSLQAESETVEARAILDYIFDGDVVAYIDQPPCLPLDYTNGAGRRIRTNTTPDFLVLRRSSGMVIEEWKPSNQREVLPIDKAGRYEIEDGRGVSPPAMASAERMGVSFQVRFSDEIPKKGL